MIKLLKDSILCIAKQYYISNFIKYHSRQTNLRNLVYLEHRTLLQLTSNDVLPFLQGLTTNDMRHFEEGAVSMYSILLNTKGKVLYDIIIYKVQGKGVFYIECDSTVLVNLMKHLKMYKLKKKVNIQTMENNMKVWAVYDTNIISQNYCNLQKNNKLEGKLFPCGINNYKCCKFIDNILIYNDPRIFELGLRILTESNVTHTELINHLGSNITIEKNTSNYRAFRYKLGIGEGVQDLSFGVSFPLEINCDYLHGVSFHKGCYIGQELTARVHHTGVIRKRLMPLIFNNINRNLEYDEKIINDDGNVVGKIRGYVGTVGLGLMRISEALASKTLFVGDCTLKIVKPQWWPQESQKNRSLENMETIESNSKEIVLQSLDYGCKNIINKNKNFNIWKCSRCHLEELYDYKGTKPPFAKYLSLLEDCYIIKNPFRSFNRDEILILGADCTICKNSVCIACSLFFTKRFCKNCALKNIKYFPRNLRNKISYLNLKYNNKEI